MADSTNSEAVSRTLPSSRAGALSGAGTRPRLGQEAGHRVIGGRAVGSRCRQRLLLQAGAVGAIIVPGGGAGWVTVSLRHALRQQRLAPGRGSRPGTGSAAKGGGRERGKQASIRADSEVTASSHIGRAG